MFLKDKTKNILNKIQGIHPLILLVLTLTGACFFFVATFSRSSVQIDNNHFQLARSKAFSNIVKCSESKDSLFCFQKYRPSLENEAEYSISSFSKGQLERFVQTIINYILTADTGIQN